MEPDGRWTSEPERGRAEFLTERREIARMRYESALREYDEVAEAVKRSQAARASWEASWQSRLKDFIAACGIEPLPREPGFVRVEIPSGETLKCRSERVEELLANHLKRTARPPVISDPGESPQMPTDEELLRTHPTADARNVLVWSAYLTTHDEDTELAVVRSDENGCPPSSFVTETLNLVAASGWRVQHISEDRVTINEYAEVVRVRYLLVSAS